MRTCVRMRVRRRRTSEKQATRPTLDPRRTGSQNAPSRRQVGSGGRCEGLLVNLCATRGSGGSELTWWTRLLASSPSPTLSTPKPCTCEQSQLKITRESEGVASRKTHECSSSKIRMCLRPQLIARALVGKRTLRGSAATVPPFSQSGLDLEGKAEPSSVPVQTASFHLSAILPTEKGGAQSKKGRKTHPSPRLLPLCPIQRTHTHQLGDRRSRPSCRVAVGRAG